MMLMASGASCVSYWLESSVPGQPKHLLDAYGHANFSREALEPLDMRCAVSAPYLPSRVVSGKRTHFGAYLTWRVRCCVKLDANFTKWSDADCVRNMSLTNSVSSRLPQVRRITEQMADCSRACEVPQACAAQIALRAVEHVEADEARFIAVLVERHGASFNPHTQIFRLFKADPEPLSCLWMTDCLINFDFSQICLKTLFHAGSLIAISDYRVLGCQDEGSG